MTTRTERPRRLPAPERRAALVEAALPLVVEHGAAVSTRRIAEAAGVAEGTIFHVFGDKEALIAAVTARALDPEPTLRALAAVDPALPLRARLVEAAEILQARLRGVFGLLDSLGMRTPPESPAAPNAINDAFRAAMVDIVGADAARLRVPAIELARLLRLLVFSGTHPWISDGRPLAATEVVDVLLDGLLEDRC